MLSIFLNTKLGSVFNAPFFQLQLGATLLLCLLSYVDVVGSVPQQPARRSTGIQRAIANAEKLRSEWTADSFRKAIAQYNLALRLLRNTNDNPEKARVLRSLGEASGAVGDYSRASAVLEEALRISETGSDREGQAEALNALCYLHLNISDNQKAFDYGKRALSISESTHNRRIEVEALNNLAEVYNLQGDFNSTLSTLERALRVRNEEDIRGHARALYTTAAVYIVKGEVDRAINLINQSLALWRSIPDRQGEAQTLQLLAAQMVYAGEYQQALDFAHQAREIFVTTGDPLGQAITIARIGYTYLGLGEPKTALGYYKEAASIYKRLGLRDFEATMLADLADVYRLLGDHKLALTMSQSALVIIRRTSDRQWEAFILNSIGTLHLDNGAHQNALQAFERAASILGEVGNPRWEAEAHKGVGLVYASMGRENKALESFGRALELARTAGDPNGESSNLYNIAKIERRRGNLDTARLRIEEALRIVDSLRAKVASRDTRASYFAFVHQQFELYVDVLMKLHSQHPQKGFDTAAFEASEKWHSRSLLEMLSEARTKIKRGANEALIRSDRDLRQRIRAAMDRRIQLLTEKAPAKQLAEIETELNSLVTDYQRLQGQIAASNPQYASITQPSSLTLKEIQQQVLDQDTTLLEFALGEESSFVWVVNHDSIKTFELPPRTQIENTARRVYELLTSWNSEVGESPAQRRLRLAQAEKEFNERSAELSNVLLAPLMKELGRKRLLIVADGALHYLPFAALPIQDSAVNTKASGRKSQLQPNSPPLIVSHEVITLPSASVLATIRKELQGRQRAPKSVAALADPVFDKGDLRLPVANSARTLRDSSRGGRVQVRERNSIASRSRDFDQGLGAGIRRLPFSRREAEAIMELVHTNDSMLALDFRASLKTATSPELSHYRIVHFATHGLLNSTHPELSGIVLSLFDEGGNRENGFLQLNDIYNLDLPADLVVLSACQTALGKDIRGEGLIGLTRGFMYAGAACVIASLWRVDDAATAELMRELYRAMLKDGKEPAEALRTAQVYMWQQKQWSAPYYWAAFTLQGEWR